MSSWPRGRSGDSGGARSAGFGSQSRGQWPGEEGSEMAGLLVWEREKNRGNDSCGFVFWLRRRGCRSWPVDRERLRVQGKKWPKEGNGQELRRKNQKGRGNQPWLCWLRRRGQQRVCSEGESEMG